MLYIRTYRSVLCDIMSHVEPPSNALASAMSYRETLTVWAHRSPPRARKCYYTGFLFVDRQKGNAAAEEAARVGNEAWALYMQGLVTLVQHRLGDAQYEYIAVRVSHRWKRPYA